MQKPVKLLNRAYIALFCINLIVSISFSMVSTTISLYVTQLGAAASVAGTVVGALSVASLCVRPFSGVISDRLERRKLLMISLAIISLSMLGYSLTHSIPVLFVLRITHGIGFSIATTVTMALVAGTIPEKQMTQGLGYFALGQTVSTAVAPSIGLWLGEHWGLGVAFALASVLLVGAIALAITLVRPTEAVRDKRSIRLQDLIAREALPFCLLSIVVAGATGLENGFVPLFGKELGLGNVGWYFTVGAIALFTARVFGGKLADRSMRTVISCGLGVMALAFVVLGGFGTAAAFAVAALLKALGLGTVQPALQAASMRSVPENRRGAASCTYYLGTDIGQAFMPMLGGVVMERAGASRMFMLYALPLAAAIVFYLVYMHRKEKGAALHGTM